MDDLGPLCRSLEKALLISAVAGPRNQLKKTLILRPLARRPGGGPVRYRSQREQADKIALNLVHECGG